MYLNISAVLYGYHRENWYFEVPKKYFKSMAKVNDIHIIEQIWAIENGLG